MGIEPQPLGSDFQVNSYTTGNQTYPGVAVAPGGDFFVVWQSDGSAGTDTDIPSVQGQRFDTAGTPIGGEFQINTWTTDTQSWPQIGIADNGNAVVVWQSVGSTGTDNQTWSIQGQRFDSAGNTLGENFQINSYTTGSQKFPDLAVRPNGDFVVAWSSNGSAGTDTSNLSIQARRFSADGSPIGNDFQVNSYTTFVQQYPGIAVDTDGDFVVVWNSYGSFGSDNDLGSIQGQLFDGGGATVGNQFQVNAFTTSVQNYPAASFAPSGSFVVVWNSYGSYGSDNCGPCYGSIQARRYDVSGTVLGNQFQVNTYLTSVQNKPVLAHDDDGSFVVVWHTFGSEQPRQRELQCAEPILRRCGFAGRRRAPDQQLHHVGTAATFDRNRRCRWVCRGMAELSALLATTAPTTAF